MTLPRPTLRRRPSARAVAGCAAVLALLGGAWLWLRASSFVAVRQVDVTGMSGEQAPRVRAALEQAAQDMTTLHVRTGQLRTAVAPFPAVASIEAHADFPHRLRVIVHEHVAVGAVGSGSDRIAVAADGTLLRGTGTARLALIDVRAGSPLGWRTAQCSTSAAANACVRSGPPLRACSRTARRQGTRTSTSASPSGPPPAASKRRRSRSRTPRRRWARSPLNPRPRPPSHDLTVNWRSRVPPT